MIGCVVLLIIFPDVIFYISRSFIAGRENCIEYCFWSGVESVQSPEEEGLVSSLHQVCNGLHRDSTTVSPAQSQGQRNEFASSELDRAVGKL